jgi:hypothetical protein
MTTILSAILALALVPVCYILTMALLGAWIANAKAIPVVIAFSVALLVFAALTA